MCSSFVSLAGIPAEKHGIPKGTHPQTSEPAKVVVKKPDSVKDQGSTPSSDPFFGWKKEWAAKF